MANGYIILAEADPHAGAHAPAATHAGTETAGHATAQGDFPPFDTQYWAPQIVWLVLVFGALYLLMSKIALPRVAGILEMRHAKISGDLATAQHARADADAAAAAHDKQLADARAKAQTTAQETQAKLTAESEAKRKALEAELSTKLVAAEAQIAATKASAMGNVNDIARDTAVAIVEHLIGTKVDPSRASEALAATKGA